MQRNHSIKDLLDSKVTADSEVEIRGWVRTRRDSKAGISFIAVHDGSCFNPLQVVAPNTLENYTSDVLRLSPGASVIVVGTLVESPAKGQDFEIQATKITVTGFIEDVETYPITPKHHTLEYLREHPDLRIRTNTIGAAMRVANTLSFAIHRYFYERDFMWVRTPLITSSDCEGAGDIFRVTTLDADKPPRDEHGKVDFNQDFFGSKAFLTVSGQLNVETYCMAMSKVYTFGPAFRAENSNTTRHLAELWMVEPEIAFSDLNDLIKLSEDFLKYLIKAVLEERRDDMEFFAQRVDKTVIERLEKLATSNFCVMEYSEAIEILQKSGQKFEFPVKWGLDLQSEHERYLTEKHVNGPMALINYPKEIKSFYMRVNEDNKTVAAMDILVPGVGELMGGSQREERYDVLDKRMQEMNIDKVPYQWYLDLRRYGTNKHGGFGMGFERLINYVTGLANIRDVIPFPRTPKNAKF